MGKKILESLDGAKTIIDYCRMNPTMDKVGECYAISVKDAYKRVAEVYGIEPKGFGFDMIVAPFRGCSEVLEVEFCELQNKDEARGILKAMDDEFKQHGLDLKEDRYPITEADLGFHDNGRITHVAFVPILKSPELPKPKPEPAKPEPAKPEPAKQEPDPEPFDLDPEPDKPDVDPELPDPEPEPAKPDPEPAKPEPAKPEPAKPDPEPVRHEHPRSSRRRFDIVRAYMRHPRKNGLSRRMAEKQRMDLKKQIERLGYAGEIHKEDCFEYQVFASTTDMVKTGILTFKKQRRAPGISQGEAAALKNNELAVSIFMRSTKRTIDRQARKNLVRKILNELEDAGVKIHNARFFAHKIKMEWVDRNTSKDRSIGYSLYIPFTVGRTRR